MGFRATFLQALQGDRKQERILVNQARAIAMAYLRTQKKRHFKLIEFTTGNIEDYALDAIADLFHRSNKELVKLKKWSVEREVFDLNESEAFIEFRKLIFTEVNDFIFSSYRKKDATLSKIIRNIKRALVENDVDGLIFNRTSGLISLSTNGHHNRKSISLQRLEIALATKLNEVKNIVDALEKVRTLLEENEHENPSVSLNDLCISIRNLSIRVNEIELEENPTLLFATSELEVFLDEALNNVKANLYNSYVLKNKLTLEEFAVYFMCVYNILRSNFITEDEAYSSYFEFLNCLIENLTPDEYKQKHRVILEYFVKKCRVEFIHLLSNELKSAERAIWKG